MERVIVSKYFLSLLIALLLLSQGVMAAPSTDNAFPSQGQSDQTEVQKEVSGKLYVDIVPRLYFAGLFFYWINKAFCWTNAPTISYQNCRAFFVHPSSFSSYYTHLSALAP